jgi:DNA-directed RNA polymerase specialized sigma24 family protein
MTWDERKRNIESLNESIKSLRSAMEYSRGVLDGLPRKPGVSKKLEEQMAELDRLLREKADACVEISCVLQGFCPEWQAVMRLRYVEGLSWEQVADQTGYARDSCMRIQRAVREKTERINSIHR